MPSLTGLKLRLEVAAYEVSIAFFRDRLGFSVLQQWGDDGAADQGCILGLHAAAGEAFIELAPAVAAPQYAGVSVQIRVDNLDQLTEDLSDWPGCRGPVARPWGSRYLYLTDPSDISLILYDGEL